MVMGGNSCSEGRGFESQPCHCLGSLVSRVVIQLVLNCLNCILKDKAHNNLNGSQSV